MSTHGSKGFLQSWNHVAAASAPCSASDVLGGSAFGSCHPWMFYGDSSDLAGIVPQVGVCRSFVEDVLHAHLTAPSIMSDALHTLLMKRPLLLVSAFVRGSAIAVAMCATALVSTSCFCVCSCVAYPAPLPPPCPTPHQVTALLVICLLPGALA